MAEDSTVASSNDGGPFKLEHNPTHGLSISEPHQAGGRRTIAMVKDGTRAAILIDLANKAAAADGWTPKSLPIGMVDTSAEKAEETPAADAEPGAAAAGSPAPAASEDHGNRRKKNRDR